MGLRPAAIDTAAPRTVGFVPVYYPGTAAPAQATLLTLRAGEERSGVDFPLTMVPTARVEGLVSSPDGAVPAGTQITLIANDPGTTGVFGFPMERAARVMLTEIQRFLQGGTKLERVVLCLYGEEAFGVFKKELRRGFR